MQIHRPNSDRIFFSLTGMWFVGMTLFGFWPSFFYRTQPDALPTHQIVHGVLFSAWVLLFLVQSLLISTRRIQWHMRLGKAALLLLILMVPVGFYVILFKTAAGLKEVDEAGFNLTGMTTGFVLAFAGIAFRKKPHVHKRLMLFATMILTIAAADRVSMILGLEVRAYRKLLALGAGIATVGYDALFRRRMLPLSISLLILSWSIVWFIISDLFFQRPEGADVIHLLTRMFIW